MNKETKNILLLFLNIIGFLGTTIINGLANYLPINNKTTGELSDQYPNMFVPAGFTFSIWGVIYILLAIFIIFHIIASIKNKSGWLLSFEKVGVIFFILSILNMAWIFAWHYELVSLSMVIMLLLLWSLLVIYTRLNIGKSDSTKREQYLVFLPFSIYLGWITVATIANATAFLVDINWGRFGLSEEIWTMVVIIVAIVIGILMLFQRRDIYFNLVVLWAFFGILSKRLAETPDTAIIINTAIAGLVIIGLGIIIQLIRRKVY